MSSTLASEPLIDERRASALGARVLADLHHFGVPPVPCYYQLWFSVVADQNPELTERAGRLLADKRILDRDDLDDLRAEFGPETGMTEANSLVAEALREAAEVLLEQVSVGQAAAESYGEALARGVGHLGRSRTIEHLVEAITVLTTETVQASERNRMLERQLTASTGRIAKLRQSLTDVKLEASTDALTGVANRRAFDQKLRRAIIQGRAERTALSLLMLDVDNFKAFNDQHGHKAGDLVLRMVGRLLTENVKGRDTVARYGGEEFAILLNGADCAAAVRVAADIADKMSRKRLVRKISGDDLGKVTASIGVAQVRDGDDAAKLVERADIALYQAKRLGRNRVCAEVGAAPPGRCYGGTSEPS